MDFSVSYQEGWDVVSGKIEGNLTRDLAAQYFTQAGEIASTRGCSKILTDVRNARLVADEPDMVSLSKELTQLGLKPAIKRAIVLAEDVKGYKVWENHCFRNGHLRLKLFFDQEQALDWLSEN